MGLLLITSEGFTWPFTLNNQMPMQLVCSKLQGVVYIIAPRVWVVGGPAGITKICLAGFVSSPPVQLPTFLVWISDENPLQTY